MASNTRAAARVSIIFGFFVKVDAMTTKMRCGKEGCACTDCGCGRESERAKKEAAEARDIEWEAQRRLLVAYYTSYSSTHDTMM